MASAKYEPAQQNALWAGEMLIQQGHGLVISGVIVSVDHPEHSLSFRTQTVLQQRLFPERAHFSKLRRDRFQKTAASGTTERKVRQGVRGKAVVGLTSNQPSSSPKCGVQKPGNREFFYATMCSSVLLQISTLHYLFITEQNNYLKTETDHFNRTPLSLDKHSDNLAIKHHTEHYSIQVRQAYTCYFIPVVKAHIPTRKSALQRICCPGFPGCFPESLPWVLSLGAVVISHSLSVMSSVGRAQPGCP